MILIYFSNYNDEERKAQSFKNLLRNTNRHMAAKSQAYCHQENRLLSSSSLSLMVGKATFCIGGDGSTSTGRHQSCVTEYLKCV